jgi:hypothetical protein
MKKFTHQKIMKRKYITIILASTISVFSTSCKEEKEGPAEKAGKEIDKAIELGKIFL